MKNKVPELITPLEPFNWGAIMQIHEPANYGHGNQIFHFDTNNKPSSINKNASELVARHFGKATRLATDADVLRYGSDHVVLDGAYLELGVATGRTTNFIAALNPTKVIYAFDSFEGLPTAWDRPDINIPQGTFAFSDRNYVPPVLDNVRLFKGLFGKSLPPFTTQVLANTPIAFLHIDCDIYESTREAFVILQENIVPGTIIVFDELYNYENYENHEWKALQELLAEKNYTADFIAFNSEHEQVAVRISTHAHDKR